MMRNKLTVFESRNQLLEQEKSDLTETVNMLGSARSEIQGKKHPLGVERTSLSSNIRRTS